jgi:lipopolysaccharide/colanic/teichoic acid biosynthesis glycosyltransferase
MKKDATALDLATLEKQLEAAETFSLRIGKLEHSQIQLALKRGLDALLSSILLILGAPLLAAIALGVKGTSPGPVIFKQTRLGRNGVPFTFYKFRTMFHDNDDAVHRSFAQSFINGRMEKRGGARIFKMVRDPRVTPLGALLRHSSLDELPQLWNVLKGEMSLVGPRPPIHYELDHYQDWHKDRLKVKPGLTGLWQVSGRSSVPFDEMVMLDLHYITHWSLTLDLKIMAKTVPVLLRGDGAY